MRKEIKIMGITCKPAGKQKSIFQKLKNRMEKEQALNKIANDADKKAKLEK